MRRSLLPLLPLCIACGSDAKLTADPVAQAEGDTPGECADNADNDADGLFDCDDPDCAADIDCATVEGRVTVAVAPAHPTSAEDLSCTASPAGDVTLQWLRDGAVSGITTDTLSARETNRGESWTCLATDPTGSSAEATVSIANGPPGAPAMRVVPTAPYAGVDDLLCEPTAPADDPDGDPVTYTATWTVDGTPAPAGAQTTWPGDTQPATATTAGERWSCTLTADDGHGGTASATATAEVASCDADADGYTAWACGGVDCDDADETVNPGQPEICNDGIDNDCDGGAASCRLEGTLDPSMATATRRGEAANDYVGLISAGGQDLNGDGNEDWAVGAYAHSGVADHSGIAWVLSGPVTGTASLSTATARIEGVASSDFMGHALALTPDLTGDGLPDLAVGASGVDDPALDVGAAYLYAGPITGAHTPVTAHATVVGVDTSGRVGARLDRIVALDGTGATALAVGAYGVGSAEQGALFLFAGPMSGHLALEDAAGRVSGHIDTLRVGQTFSSGDIDGDGLSDLALGLPEIAPGGGVCVVMGPLTGERSTADADHCLAGEESGDGAGSSVAVVGDTNSDGYDDLLVGAPWMDLSGRNAVEGQAYLVLGPATAVDLAHAHGELRGESPSAQTGQHVGAPGDVDGDGFDDMLVGAFGNDAGGEHAGSIHLVYGPVTGRVLLASEGMRVLGQPGQYMGGALAGSDQNGDGCSDIMFGAFGDDTAGENAGLVHIMEGGGL